MKCRQTQELMTRYLDGDLQPSQASEFKTHLESCTACEREMQAMKRALSVLEMPKRSFDPPDVLSAVKVQVARPTRTPVFGVARWSLTAAAAAGLAVWLLSTLHAPAPVKKPTLVVRQPVSVSTPERVAPVTAETPKEKQPVTVAYHSGRKIHRAHRIHPMSTMRVRNAAPAPATPVTTPNTLAQEEYLVVYMPPAERTPAPTASDSGVEAPESSSYAIQVIDTESGEITRLSVKKESQPGEEPSVTIDYGVKEASPETPNGERSLIHESPSFDYSPSPDCG